MGKELTIDSAKQLLHDHMQNQNLRRHCYAVGLALKNYFDYYISTNTNVGALTKDQWEIVGILHDADWEETANVPTEHTLRLLNWLGEYNAPLEMLNVFKSHNQKITHLRALETLLEWTLECCDELTGFIVAVALVMPNKKLSDVTVERVIKRFKQKEFARAVDREQITQCEIKVNVPTEKFIEITLSAMQQNAELLGL